MAAELEVINKVLFVLKCIYVDGKSLYDTSFNKFRRSAVNLLENESPEVSYSVIKLFILLEVYLSIVFSVF